MNTLSVYQYLRRNIMKKKKIKLTTKGILKLIAKGINVPEMLSSLITSTLTYKLDITSARFDLLMSDINKYFKHLPKSAEGLIMDYSKYASKYWREEDDAYIAIPGKFYDWCIYKGTLCILTFIIEKDKNRGTSFVIYLSCLNTKHDIDNLRDFVKLLIRNHDKYNDRNTRGQIRFINENGVYPRKKMDKRTFDDVFIAQRERDELVRSITGFMKNKKWYREHSIPYHFGIILHGPAGTGKSSIIKAISEEFDTFLYYVEPGQLPRALNEKQNWYDTINANVKTAIVVIEDVDRYSFLLNKEWYSTPEFGMSQYEWSDDDAVDDDKSKKSKAKTNNDQYYLGVLLNLMDGMNSPENVIWIFTTNHIDRLDPALIRPGRIDKKIEIGYVDNETLSEFLMHHYGKGLESGYEVGGGLTFASIQTDVMLGMTYEEILEKYCNQGGI